MSEQPRSSLLSQFGKGLLIVFAIGWVANYLNERNENLVKGSAPTVVTDEKKQVFLAAKTCILALKTALNDPESARFDPLDTWGFFTSGELISIFPSLRAKNVFGGYVHTRWQCRGRFVSGKFIIEPDTFHQVHPESNLRNLRLLGELK